VAKLNPSISQRSRKDENKFDYNKDVDMIICPAGHLDTRKSLQRKKCWNKQSRQILFRR
jgi:hypothetical protein